VVAVGSSAPTGHGARHRSRARKGMGREREKGGVFEFHVRAAESACGEVESMRTRVRPRGSDSCVRSAAS